MNWIHAHAVIAYLTSFVFGSIVGRLLKLYLIGSDLTTLIAPAFDARNYRGKAIVEPRKHGAFFER